ncbi:2-(1,2-epoxy-1,2-dihydrophenyl)acetyl-CoA isomerase PaaG [Sporichthya brevicatena]|uniref:2-(1,2-epoxy-1,2-dihydrophenyl)acetyl-CoA isomerase PaaG n=1 Tax=Sporichthya brevicatena TaxID=171442 RepID=A0ABP3RJ43_9ACTN
MTDDVTAQPELLVTRDAGVLTLTLNRPDVLNALSVDLGNALVAELVAAGKDPEVRAVVVTGAGRGFCAGADFTGQTIAEGQAPDYRTRLLETFNPIIAALREMPKPAVAAVNGVAAGIGLSTVLACDVILAAESAKFVSAFSGVALSPDGGLVAHCAARIGITRTAQLVYLGERLTADRALDWGLINAVHPDAELMPTALALAAQLAAGPTVAHAGAKEQFNAVISDLAAQLDHEADLQQRNAETADHVEGVNAFMEKRAPNFRGR